MGDREASALARARARRAGDGRGLRIGLSVRQSIALGLLHGPAELLPISSSAHVEIVPWLLGWDYVELDPELRKSFEVMLHAGTAAALAIARPVAWRDLSLLGLSAAPAALAGYFAERPVERHLGTPATIAGGLLAGAVAMALADRSPGRRRYEDATAADALWLGLAQATALVPGVSRGGATLAAARLRGFSRPDSHRLSRQISLPVIAGATLLKLVRVRRHGLDRRALTRFSAGAGAAFVSALVAVRPAAGDGPLWPYAVYRVALAVVIVRRLARLPSGRCSTMRS